MSIEPIQLDLIWIGGRFNAESLTLQDGAGTGIDLSAATLTAQVRSRPADASGPGDLILALKVGELTTTGSDPDDLATGAISIWAEADDMAAIEVGTVGVWELVAEIEAGRPERIAVGRWECVPPVAVLA